jgi:hypothetical protein
MREKLLKLAEAYRNRDERLMWPDNRSECSGICKTVTLPEYGFTCEEVTKVREAVSVLPSWDDIGFKWAYDDWDSRAAWLEKFAEGIQ